MCYDVAIVGTGPTPDDPDTDGYAMAYEHAAGYQRLADCEITACVDIVREHAAGFADRYGLPDAAVYEDHQEMVRSVEPDIVSVCVPPAAHSDIVVDCAASGVVAAIHCEKPMATTWSECQEMVDVSETHDVQLTINHQRRFGTPFRKAKTLLDGGRIGDLQRVEMGGKNLYDYGTHFFDLCNYYVDQTPAKWVLGQVDYREENVQFGVHNENQALLNWEYENGVHGLASTGEHSIVNCHVRLVGTSGTIEVGADSGPPLRARWAGDRDWEQIDTGNDGIHGPQPGYFRAALGRIDDLLPTARRLPGVVPTHVERAIADVVESLDTGTESELSARTALDATELIFAGWESARRRGRVDLPLDIEDNPLEAMVQSGTLSPDAVEQ
jgi:predicted dehydrogenase